MNNFFWSKLEKPIIGLAPMDGITDPAFRYIICKYGSPSVVFTEFVNVEGLARGNTKKLPAFLYNKIERPIVAQLFGVEVESFYKAAIFVCFLGFDGIDINMGCPANKVTRKGSGAGLIRTPELAQEIIKKVKEAVKDFKNGITLEEAGVHPDLIAGFKKPLERIIIPISIKTRLGYDKNISQEWVKKIIEVKPDLITMHGRTLKQMYEGQADWEALRNACEICHDAGILFLGNGDVSSIKDAKEKVKKYKVDGVLIGRGACHNPWIFNEKFSDKEIPIKERLKVVKAHINYFEKLAYAPFCNIKKHFSFYLKNFDGAKELRMKLMQAKDYLEARKILANFGV